MTRTPFYHIGVVVPDLEEAQAHLSEILDLSWGAVREYDVNIAAKDGRSILTHLRICFSVEEPRFELIEEAEGTPWTCNEFSNIHHVGFFAEDVGASSDRLSNGGCPLEWTIPSVRPDEQGMRTVYHWDPLGIRLEFSPTAIRHRLEQQAFKPV